MRFGFSLFFFKSGIEWVKFALPIRLYVPSGAFKLIRENQREH